MSRRKTPMNQLELPIGNIIGHKHDPDEAFEREYGAERAAQERIRYREARCCTCSSAHPNKWGAKWGHKPPCPRAGRKF